MAPSHCGCHRTGQEETFTQRVGRELRETTVPEWLQIALGAGALFLAWKVYKEVRR